MEIAGLSVIGFILGMVTIIPGLSVATLAIAFNVYDRLINVITPDVKKILAARLFWLPMVIGGIAGIIFASKAVTILLENYHVPVYWFFIGIISGSIPCIYSMMRRPDSALPSLTPMICCVLAVIVMVIIAVYQPDESANVVHTEFSWQIFGMLVLAGALAAIAMIIPGISGAFMLLITGYYYTALQAVSDFNISLMSPIILGAIFGLLSGAALVRLLLSKAPSQTYGAVLGLAAGSVLILYPGGFGEGYWIFISAACLLFGFAVSFLMGRKKTASYEQTKQPRSEEQRE